MHLARRALVAGFSAAILLTSFSGVAAAHGTPATATYRVTVLDLSPGQPFTPPLIALHRPNVDVFSVDRRASYGVQQIAENGNLDPLLATLGATRGVSAMVHGDAPLVPFGTPGAATFGTT